MFQPLTFEEDPVFTEKALRLIGDDGIFAIQMFLYDRPDAGISFPARVVAENFAGRQKATENEGVLASSIIGSLRTTESCCLIFMQKTNAKIPAPIASGN